jgi:hypothetical protein
MNLRWQRQGANLGDMVGPDRERILVPLLLLVAACANGGPVIPDHSAKTTRVSTNDDANPDDVFLRAPWEQWRTPNGPARYHRGTYMLLPNAVESFKVGDISIYAKDGSDVRLDYHSVDFGSGSQSLGTIRVSVSPATGEGAQEWASAADDLRRRHPGAETTEPFPIPVHYPADTRQVAFLLKRDDRFVQLSLFRHAGWTVRYEISCPAEDIAVARKTSLAFLTAIRYRE